MALTYIGDLSTDLDKVRFHIQDTVDGSGPKPGGDNFEDDELDGLVTIEGTWQKAVAASFEVLSAAWSSYADISVGPRSEQFSQIAERYHEQAEKWRDDFGSTATTRAGTRHPTRIDGYSDDVASDET
jgi:hypothetical protein